MIILNIERELDDEFAIARGTITSPRAVVDIHSGEHLYHLTDGLNAMMKHCPWKYTRQALIDIARLVIIQRGVFTEKGVTRGRQEIQQGVRELLGIHKLMDTLEKGLIKIEDVRQLGLE